MPRFNPPQCSQSDYVSDASVPACPGCGKSFGVLTRRHHCKYCGNVFCDKCTPKQNPPAERCCEMCRNLYQETNQALGDAETHAASKPQESIRILEAASGRLRHKGSSILGFIELRNAALKAIDEARKRVRTGSGASGAHQADVVASPVWGDQSDSFGPQSPGYLLAADYSTGSAGGGGGGSFAQPKSQSSPPAQGQPPATAQGAAYAQPGPTQTTAPSTSQKAAKAVHMTVQGDDDAHKTEAVAGGAGAAAAVGGAAAMSWSGDAGNALKQLSGTSIATVVGTATSNALKVVADVAPFPINSALLIVARVCFAAASVSVNKENCAALAHRITILAAGLCEASGPGQKLTDAQSAAVMHLRDVLEEARKYVDSFSPDKTQKWYKLVAAKAKAFYDCKEHFDNINQDISQAETTLITVFTLTKPSTAIDEATIARAFEAESAKLLEAVMAEFAKISRHGAEGIFLAPCRLVIDHTRVLGRGGSSVVYGGTLDGTKQVAVKVPNHTDPATAAALTKEVNKMRQAAHPNVVRVHGILTDPAGEGCHGIVMEELRYPLPNLIRPDGTVVAKGVKISDEEKLRWLHQIALAMDHLHTNLGRQKSTMLFLDLKPDNVMVTADRRAAKLVDFGSVVERHSLDGDLTNDAIRGTPQYMAPECLDDRRRSEIAPKTDVFSFGSVAYELFSGQELWSGIPHLAIMQAVVNDKRSYVTGAEMKKQGVPPGMIAVIEACWRDTVSKRPPFGVLKTIRPDYGETVLDRHGKTDLFQLPPSVRPVRGADYLSGAAAPTPQAATVPTPPTEAQAMAKSAPPPPATSGLPQPLGASSSATYAASAPQGSFAMSPQPSTASFAAAARPKMSNMGLPPGVVGEWSDQYKDFYYVTKKPDGTSETSWTHPGPERDRLRCKLVVLQWKAEHIPERREAYDREADAVREKIAALGSSGSGGAAPKAMAASPSTDSLSAAASMTPQTSTASFAAAARPKMSNMGLPPGVVAEWSDQYKDFYYVTKKPDGSSSETSWTHPGSERDRLRCKLVVLQWKAEHIPERREAYDREADAVREKIASLGSPPANASLASAPSTSSDTSKSAPPPAAPAATSSRPPAFDMHLPPNVVGEWSDQYKEFYYVTKKSDGTSETSWTHPGSQKVQLECKIHVLQWKVDTKVGGVEAYQDKIKALASQLSALPTEPATTAAESKPTKEDDAAATKPTVASPVHVDPTGTGTAPSTDGTPATPAKSPSPPPPPPASEPQAAVPADEETPAAPPAADSTKSSKEADTKTTDNDDSGAAPPPPPPPAEAPPALDAADESSATYQSPKLSSVQPQWDHPSGPPPPASPPPPPADAEDKKDVETAAAAAAAETKEPSKDESGTAGDSKTADDAVPAVAEEGRGEEKKTSSPSTDALPPPPPPPAATADRPPAFDMHLPPHVVGEWSDQYKEFYYVSKKPDGTSETSWTHPGSQKVQLECKIRVLQWKVDAIPEGCEENVKRLELAKEKLAELAS